MSGDLNVESGRGGIQMVKDTKSVFIHSVEDSLWQWWFSKGQLKTRGKYNKGKKEGRWIEWYDNEKLMYSYTYKKKITC